ncbi:MAG: lactate/malate family dehydrogenase [Slackia sp.]
MIKPRTVGIVGMGHVGAHVANSLLLQGLADELYLCDIDFVKSASETQDLRDSLIFCPYNAKIVDCQDRYEELAGCDVIVNAAGKVSLAAGNRDGELFFTTDTCRTFANRIVDAGFDGIWVSVSNPCDVVCTELWHLTGYDPSRIIGSGTGLDYARLRSQISLACNLDSKSINAYMIGEHGASMLAAWKSASISGKPLSQLADEDPDRFAFDLADIEDKARQGGYVAYAGKQCTEYAVANAAVRVVAAVLHDEHAVMGASTLLTGQYGEEDFHLVAPHHWAQRSRARHGLELPRASLRRFMPVASIFAITSAVLPGGRSRQDVRGGSSFAQ